MRSSPRSVHRSCAGWWTGRPLSEADESRHERRRSGLALALAGSAVGFGLQLVLLTSAGAIYESTAWLVAVTLALVSVAMVALPPRRFLSEIAFLAAVAGMGGLGMLVGGRLGAGTAGMLIGCLATCLWLCQLRGLCARDRDWRHHAIGLIAMVGGMIGGAMLLTTMLTPFVAGAASHFAMVLGMAAGTGVGMWIVDRYDDRQRRVRRDENRLPRTTSLPHVGPN